MLSARKIGAALPPQESTAPTKSPIPLHPDEVGADIIKYELWPTVGSKLASHILSGLLRQGYTCRGGLADLATGPVIVGRDRLSALGCPLRTISRHARLHFGSRNCPSTAQDNGVSSVAELPMGCAEVTLLRQR